MNNATHEVDVSKLTVKGDSISGTITVLLRDDKAYDINPPAGSIVGSGEGGLLCNETTITATRADDAWTGTHESTLGIAWEHSGTISGTLSPDQGQDHAAQALGK